MLLGAGRVRRCLAAVAALLVVATAGSVAASHSEALDDLLPHTHAGFDADPAPIPDSSVGRIPVSLRLTDSIWTDDGTHPQAATQIRFELDESFRLDLSDFPRCPTGLHYDIRTGESPCEKLKFVTGKMKFEVAFPEQEPLVVTGRAIAFKTNGRKITIRAYLPAPVTGEVLIPVQLAKASDGSIYGLTATASIPKVAGGSGSLLYLGLRFRKGLFSLACGDGRLQSRVTDSLADGTKLSVALLTNC